MNDGEPSYYYNIQQTGSKARELRTTNQTGGITDNTFITSFSLHQKPSIVSYDEVEPVKMLSLLGCIGA